MDTLAHILTAMENTAAQGWSNQGSVSLETAVSPILRDLALLTHNPKIYSSVQRISGMDNNMADDASRLTHLTDNMFLCHFDLTFPQKILWRLLTLPSGCKRQLTSILNRNLCPMDSRHSLPKGLHRMAPMAQFLQVAGDFHV